MKAHRHFTRKQRKEAKAKFKKFKTKSRDAWLYGRDQIIQAIVTTKHTPNYQLKVTLLKV